MKITQKRLMELVIYDKNTGIFTRKRRIGGMAIGRVAGHIKDNGYLHFCVDGIKYGAHRLVWFYINGVFPKADIDHINGIRTDNRLCNLREVSRSENLQNSLRVKKHNKSTGILGAYANGSGFISKIRVLGNSKYIGYYDTAEKAHAAYMQAKRKYHAGFVK